MKQGEMSWQNEELQEKQLAEAKNVLLHVVKLLAEELALADNLKL